MSNYNPNDPSIKSWVEIDSNSDFSIQNLPFGIFKTESLSPRVGVALGEFIIDLKSLETLGYLENLPYDKGVFGLNKLNPLMKYGKKATADLRARISKLFNAEFPDLQSKKQHIDQVLVPMSEATMLLPIEIGDYTDFYSSREHATNVGSMFRDPSNPLLPNWLHIPVGYHGRASSVILSGQDIHRPMGQLKADDQDAPTYGPSKLMDFELEMGFFTYEGKPLGDQISTAEAEDYIFGMVLFNDWSARDIQKWEYVPLGPFLGKNFASSMSPWIVTLDALKPFATETPKQDPKVLPYLEFEGLKSYDIQLEAYIQPEGKEETKICTSNFKYMYWNMAQQLAHHTVNGCNIRCGDLLASGTISGPTEDSYGSLLELSWRGTKPLPMKDGSERRFLQDNDYLIMRGFSNKDGVRVGFGEVKTKLLPAKY